jgi:hypothetical protein
MLDSVQNLMCGEPDVKRDIWLVLNQGSYCTEIETLLSTFPAKLELKVGMIRTPTICHLAWQIPIMRETNLPTYPGDVPREELEGE